jgi:1,5-anhydro-D-fructose reductase (1,5-anhydro-D-mannitol-forming)
MESGWAIVATGRVSNHTARAVRGVAGVRLAAVMSRDLQRAREFADRHGAERGYDSLDGLLAHPGVDVVYVATPNGLHCEQVVAAAAAGKHILCEKPMALDAGECHRMIDACASAGVHLGTAFHYRHHPAHARMRDVIRSGAVGVPVFADASVHVATAAATAPPWYSDPRLSGGGVLPMTGVHRLDLLRYLLGQEVVEVSAMMATRNPRRPFEDTVAVLLQFNGGTMATVRMALGATPASDPVAVYGTEGWVAGSRTMSSSYPADGGTLSSVLSGLEATERFEPPDLYADQVAAFDRTVRTGAPLVASGVDGLRGVELAAAVYAAARTSRVVRPGEGA